MFYKTTKYDDLFQLKNTDTSPTCKQQNTLMALQFQLAPCGRMASLQWGLMILKEIKAQSPMCMSY